MRAFSVSSSSLADSIPEQTTRHYVLSSTVILWTMVAIKLLIHFATNSGYGFHRDEFLYLAMAKHLDSGFVEVPPLIALFARFTRTVLGESLFATRFLPALFGAGVVLLTGLMCLELKGKQFAVALACLSVIISPLYLRANTFFHPVVFDQFFWVSGAYLMIRLLNSGNQRIWLLFGVVAGIGLLNKYSMLFFGFGVFVGLLLTPERKMLRERWPWLAGLIAFLFILPNIFWQAQHGWPLMNHMSTLSGSQLIHVRRHEFILEQILIMHPLTFPVWITGLVFLFFPSQRRYRLIAWSYVTVFILLLLARGKAYYLGPAYPMLLASGSVFLEQVFSKPFGTTLKPVLLSFFVIGGVLTAPLGLPVLPRQHMERYSKALGLTAVTRTENRHIERLPQDFADMTGWPDQVESVARVYQSLSPDEQKEVVIIAGNYGEAGAIDLWGPRYGLPAPISTNSSFYLWGPGERYGKLAITIGISREDLQPFYQKIDLVDTVGHEYAIYYERDLPVFIARDPKGTLQDIWPGLGMDL